MSDTDERVRTPERPMAFSSDEFMAGGFWTWVVFCALTPYGILASMLTSPPSTNGWEWTAAGLQIAGFLFLIWGMVVVVSLVLTPVGLALAWPVARLLRRVRSLPIHVVAYTVLGVAVAMVYVSLTGGVGAFTSVNTYTIVAATPAVAITVATPLGWWIAARHALQKDAGLIRARRDVDADVEDAALEA